MTDLLDVALWIVQALLAVVFLLAGAMHAFRYEAAKKNLPWVKDLPRGVVILDWLSSWRSPSPFTFDARSPVRSA